MRIKKVTPYLMTLSDFFIRNHRIYSKQDDISCIPFFIIGSGRNGSTLLSSLLNGHSKIFIPREQFILPYAIIRYKLYNFLPWRDLIKIIIGELLDPSKSENWEVDLHELFDRLIHLPIEKRSLQKIVDELVLPLANKNKADFEVWGDKSIPNTWMLEYIYSLYPLSKYIFLIRDGRDVISSYHNDAHNTFGEYSQLDKAAALWNDSIKKWKWLQKKARGNQLLEIKYEDLVDNPEIAITKILTFLGYSFEASMLEFHDQVYKMQLDTLPQHSNLKNPINTNSIRNWKINLDIDQVKRIIPLIKKNLKIMGYEV